MCEFKVVVRAYWERVVQMDGEERGMVTVLDEGADGDDARGAEEWEGMDVDGEDG